MKNYYEILEVDKNASEEVIEKAYKTLAKKYHPDLQNNSDCQDKMRQINEAYEILSNDFNITIFLSNTSSVKPVFLLTEYK